MKTMLKTHNVSYSLALVLAALTLGIGTAGYWYHASQKDRARHQAGNQLAAVAELKVNEIARWRGERIADAHIVMDTPFVGLLAQQCLANPEDSRSSQEFLDWMRSYKDHYDYYSVSLLDTNGIVRLSIPEGEQTDAPLLAAFPGVMRSRKPALVDLERSQTVPRIHIDLIIPLSSAQRGDNPLVGALLLRIDPYKFLYPLIQSWPTTSPTSETLLVRREGEEVVFLNELRDRKDTALSLKVPVNGVRCPAVMAAEGVEGIVEAVDYRGSQVLAAIKRLPGTPWVLIAKIDSDEVYAPVHEQAVLIAFLITLMIIGAGVTLGLIWSYQRSLLYLKQYKTESEKLELAQRYEHLTKYANDIILLVKADGGIGEANQRALSTYGYSLDEMVRMNIRDLETPETLPVFEARMKLAEELDGFVFETVHRRKDGSEFPVEISTRSVELAGSSFYLKIIRDITERKQAERELQKAHDGLEVRVRERTADLMVMNELLKNEIEVRKRAEGELRAVTTRLADTEETERRRLARELHDRVGQSLTALNFNMSAIMNLLPAESPAEATSRLRDSLVLVEDTVRCVRDVMADLRPPLLDDYGLSAVLRWYCREFAQRSGIHTASECEDPSPRLGQSVEIALFRIAQEALSNVMRHARASQAKVKLESTAKSVRMTISDDGTGFEPNASGSPQTQRSGWGMLSMRERAEMVGGRLQVDSEPGRGTRVAIEVRR